MLQARSQQAPQNKFGKVEASTNAPGLARQNTWSALFTKWGTPRTSNQIPPVIKGLPRFNWNDEQAYRAWNAVGIASAL